MPGGVVGANTPGVGGAVDIAYLEGLKGAVSQQLGAARAGADSAVENARTTLTKLEQAKANGVSSEALANATEAVRIIARDAENERRGVQSKKQTIDAQRQPLDREINRLLDELKEKTNELIGEKNKSWMRRDDAKIAQITGEMSQLQAAIQSKKTEKTPLDEDFDVQEQLLTTISAQEREKAAPHLETITKAHQNGTYDPKQLQEATKRLEAAQKARTKLDKAWPQIQAAAAQVQGCLQSKINQLMKPPPTQRGDASGDKKDSPDFGAAAQEADKIPRGGKTQGTSKDTGLGGGNTAGQRHDPPVKPGSTGTRAGLPAPYGYPGSGPREDSVEVDHNTLQPLPNPGKSSGMSGKPGKKSGCAC